MGSRDIRPVAAQVFGSTRTHSPTAVYGIVIGIDRYPAIGDLRGACNDAERFYAWLTDRRGGAADPDRVRLRLGRNVDELQKAHPNRVEFDDDLDALVLRVRAERWAGRSRLWLYFAGHGLAAGAGTGSWLMADARESLFASISIARYQEWLDRCRDFDEVVVLSDCCRRILDTVQELPPPHTICVEPTLPQQRVFLAHAAALNAFALEASRTAQEGVVGYFTTALLEGLRGAAGNPGTGEVCGSGLRRYLEHRVFELSGGTQRAEVPHDGGDNVFARCWDDVHPVRIALTGAPRPLQIFRGGQVVAGGVHGDGTWLLSLRDGTYSVGDATNGRFVPFSVSGGPADVDL